MNEWMGWWVTTKELDNVEDSKGSKGMVLVLPRTLHPALWRRAWTRTWEGWPGLSMKAVERCHLHFPFRQTCYSAARSAANCGTLRLHFSFGAKMLLFPANEWTRWGYSNLATPTQHRTPCWAACPGAHCCFSDLHCSLRLFLPTPASSSLSLIMSHINKPFKFSALAPTPQRTQLTYCLTAYFISGIWQGLGHSRAPPIFVE